MYEDPLLGDVKVYPHNCTIAFLVGLHNWSFTLSTFVKMYASKQDVDKRKYMRLWIRTTLK